VSQRALDLRSLDERELTAVIEVMCLAALADGEVTGEERAALARSIALASGGRCDPDEAGLFVTAAASALARDGRSARLRELAARLPSEATREAALAAAVRVMTTDGIVRTAERELVAELAEGLGLDPGRAADLVREHGG
jgi:tellurite resistance protein